MIPILNPKYLSYLYDKTVTEVMSDSFFYNQIQFEKEFARLKQDIEDLRKGILPEHIQEKRKYENFYEEWISNSQYYTPDELGYY
jgi:hypothetical protein